MKTTVKFGVIAFIVLLTALFYFERAEARVTLGLSQGLVHSNDLVTQRIGWTDDKWFVRAERLGGEEYNDTWGISAGRRVYATDWRVRPFLELGASYFEEQLRQKGDPLVSENLTFELVGGASWKLSPESDIELAWVHNSTAGRSDQNTGIDRVYLGYTWSF